MVLHGSQCIGFSLRCGVGCYCKDGYARANGEKCVNIADCPKYVNQPAEDSSNWYFQWKWIKDIWNKYVNNQRENNLPVVYTIKKLEMTLIRYKPWKLIFQDVCKGIPQTPQSLEIISEAFRFQYYSLMNDYLNPLARCKSSVFTESTIFKYRCAQLSALKSRSQLAYYY